MRAKERSVSPLTSTLQTLHCQHSTIYKSTGNQHHQLVIYSLSIVNQIIITRFTTSPASSLLIISNYKNAANSKTLILHPLYLVGIDLFYIIIFYNGNRVNHIRFRSTVIWKREYSEKIHFLFGFVKRFSKVTRKT